MKIGKDLLPAIEALGEVRKGNEQVSFKQLLQIGPNGVSYDYMGPLRHIANDMKKTFKALLDSREVGTIYENSNVVLIFDPNGSTEFQRWKNETLMYKGVKGAKEYLHFQAFGHFERKEYGRANSVFPLFADYLKGMLKYHSHKKERETNPLNVQLAARLLFFENSDARRMHAISEKIRSTMQSAAMNGPTEEDTEKIFSYAKEGFEIGYGKKFGEDLCALK